MFLLFLYRNHTHETSHFLTKKNNIYIYNIYISLMLRKSVGCAKVPCVPSSSGRLPSGGLPAGLLECFLRAWRSRAAAATGGGLYLDVSMFSSLKLLQCSVTFLETTGERGVEGGLESGWPLSLLAGRSGC